MSYGEDFNYLVQWQYSEVAVFDVLVKAKLRPEATAW